MSLRAAAVRTRAFNLFPALSNSFRRPVTTGGNSSESAKGKRSNSPPSFIDNAPGWNEELATTSEASVKADRETTTLDEMRRKTVDYVQSHHPINDPEVVPTHATYAREEVSGPLGNAGIGVGEFEGVVGNEDLGPDDVHVESNGRVVTRHVTHERGTLRESTSDSGVGRPPV